MIKSLLLSARILLMAIAMSSIPLYAAETHGPVLTFSTPEYDCGVVYYDSVSIKTIDIEFYNTGNAPLLIDGVDSCCGTVVTYWPKEPILPGEKGKIEVRFRITKQPGTIQRIISIISNDAEKYRKRYHIKGKIKKNPQ